MMMRRAARHRVGHDPAGVPPAPVVVGYHACPPVARVVIRDVDVVFAEGTRVEQRHPLAGTGGEAFELHEGVVDAPPLRVGGGASRHLDFRA